MSKTVNHSARRNVALLVPAALLLLLSCALEGEVTGASEPLEPTSVAPPAERFSRTFTSADDWADGNFDGVNDDSPGQVQMTAGLKLYETPFIWIPNSDERTVSKIDTQTRTVVGTFPLVNSAGEACHNPSRTTVDIDGNVWVGCRGTNSYINRSAVTASKVPVQVDRKVMKLAKDDGHVMLSLEVGHAPRAMAIDARNHVWIGCSVDDTVWELDGNSGACLRGEAANCAAPAISVPDFPYGMAVDQRGHLWVVQNELPTNKPDQLTEIDTLDGSVLGIYGPYLRNGCNDLYGIAIDQMNDIWLGGHNCDDVVKVKGVSGIYHADLESYTAGEMIDAFDVGGTKARGLAIDLDGNVWVAMSDTGTAAKLNNVSGAIMQTLNVGQGPIGVGVDAYGNAWVVNRSSNSVHWVNGLDSSQSQEIDVGLGPYTYSDMLGMALRTITMRGEGFANWRTVVDSGVADPQWDSVHWTANVPERTSLKVRTRVAASTAELSAAPWGAFLDAPGTLDVAQQAGRFAEVEARFYANGTTASPILFDLTVYWID